MKTVVDYLRRRRIKKRTRELLRHSRHVRHMREDAMPKREREQLKERENALREIYRKRAWDDVAPARDALTETLIAATPKRALAGVRENLEVLVVAVAVAMGFRAYFLQPFKIPTGSMQPTLFGITSEDRAEPGTLDRMPFKPFKWLITGEWYRTVTVQRAGTLGLQMVRPGQPYVDPNYPNDVYYVVAGRRYRVPKRALEQEGVAFELGAYVPAGAVLWAGSRTAGDHVFVDKVRWNFFPPRRGQVMVFGTRGIEKLEEHLAVDRHGQPISTHYIKRMCGLPGEKIAIEAPWLLIGGEPVRAPWSIRRIAERAPGYAGYCAGGQNADWLRYDGQEQVLSKTEYAAFGDNTRNSRDSRYWGPVPRRNLVGPACWVYWPFHRKNGIGRWGLIR